jgi:hypothetical protein
MGKTDRAIVVGIQSYPEMPALEGPENDAQDFYNWLIDERGGDVKPKHARLITTPQEKLPFKNTEDAVPTFQEIEDEGYRLIKLAAKKPLKDGHRYLGRRLYLYFAGHGFAPREEQTALIMANATKMRIGAGFHWLGQWTAEWFYRAGYFDEVILLMDCCRNILPVPALSMPWPDETAPDFQERVKRFYAFATGWSLEARGEADNNGKVRGIFTQALLDGLRKYGHVPHSDAVTTDSLAAYIRSRIPTLQPSDFRADSFELGRISEPVGQFQVKIKIPPQAAGKAIEVDTMVNGATSVICSSVAAPPEWIIHLYKGFYRVQVPELGLKQTFDVMSSEVPDVELS